MGTMHYVFLAVGALALLAGLAMLVQRVRTIVSGCKVDATVVDDRAYVLDRGRHGAAFSTRSAADLSKKLRRKDPARIAKRLVVVEGRGHIYVGRRRCGDDIGRTRFSHTDREGR